MPKAKVSVSLDVDLIAWIDRQVEEGRFESRSEGVEYCMKRVREILEGWREG